MKKNNHTW